MSQSLHGSLGPTSDCLILTHGAGSNREAPLLVALAEACAHTGLVVLRYDLPFRQQRPQGPPTRGSAEADRLGLRSVVSSLRQQTSGRLWLGGHSYGGRQSSMLAAEEPGLVDCLLLLSYPLHPPRRPAELRTAHFPQLHVPALFVHGTRDPFGSIEELTAALKLIPATTELLALQGVGHELTKASARADQTSLIAERFRTFVGLSLSA